MAALPIAMALGCAAAKTGATELLGKLVPDHNLAAPELPKAGPTKVVADASALALDLPESDVESRSRFEKRFAGLMDEGRVIAADILVARHPDHAYQLLSQATSNSETVTALAAAYDRFCRSEDGWQKVIESFHSPATLQYFALRSKWFAQVTNGDFGDTQSIDLVAAASQTSCKALLADAWYQQGIGAILRGDNSAAANHFSQCASVAASDLGMLSANALLLCSEAHRRAGDFGEANASWRSAVSTACQLMSQRAVSDPVFWDRASYLQPVGIPWPAEVAVAFEQLVTRGPSALRTDLLRQLAQPHSASAAPPASCWVEAATGSWLRQRGESHRALVRMKKAESYATPTRTVMRATSR
ncbi:MAG: hypothetical protein MI861_06040, partial [Pirellulales bacterium]|nr:hypothetical protein [Pirellulales bacterium]